MNKIGIVILNWNNYEDTKRCLASVLPYINDDNCTQEVELFLIDNDSKDGSSELLEKEFADKVNYYNTGYNGGYTGGNNFGIFKAIELQCDYILILNNDLEIENFSLMLDNIEKIFKSNEQIGILGFEIFNQQSKKRLKSGSNSDKLFNKLLNIESTHIDLGDGKSISTQRSVCGCAICFRTTCINEIGVFDESFFMYAEEHDICLRAIKSEWKVVKIEDKNVRICRNIDPVSANQLIWYYGTRNIFCVYRKNLNFFNKYIFSLIQLFIYIKQVLYFFIYKQYKISFKICKGLLDGLLGKNCNKRKKT